jgi:hypothetical protein
MKRTDPYQRFSGRHAHTQMWEQHHGLKVGKGNIVHHKNENKRDNRVCSRPAPCPNLKCGNLERKTRAQHILEHKPGRMGGRHIPNKKPKKVYRCKDCGRGKSHKGDRCVDCARAMRYGAKDGLTRKKATR